MSSFSRCVAAQDFSEVLENTCPHTELLLDSLPSSELRIRFQHWPGILPPLHTWEHRDEERKPSLTLPQALTSPAAGPRLIEELHSLSLPTAQRNSVSSLKPFPS